MKKYDSAKCQFGRTVKWDTDDRPRYVDCVCGETHTVRYADEPVVSVRFPSWRVPVQAPQPLRKPHKVRGSRHHPVFERQPDIVSGSIDYNLTYEYDRSRLKKLMAGIPFSEMQTCAV
jgi:hypothetical protein